MASATCRIPVILALGLTSFSCKSGGSDCSSCNTDGDCSSGFCAYMGGGRFCASWESGSSTQCCTPTGPSISSCSIYYGTGSRTHSCVGTPLTCSWCGDPINGVGCSNCPGCIINSGVTECSGTTYADCVSCDGYFLAPASGNCSNCPGCTTSALAVCSGTPYGCGGYGFQTTCEAHGCTWNIADGSCAGVPMPCSTYADATSCTSANLCKWSACTGTPTPCSQLTSFAACLYSGSPCKWKPSCQGTPTRCEQLTSETCSSQPGCACN